MAHGFGDRAWGRLAGGAFGAGKSIFLVMDAIMALEEHPGIRIVFLRQTLKDLKESTQVVFFEDVLGVKIDQAGQHRLIDRWDRTAQHLRWWNGSEVWWAHCSSSGERVSGGARSKVFGKIYFDEITEIGESSFQEWTARLRQPGMPNNWAAATNPEPNWVKQRFHPSSKERMGGVAFFQTRTAENVYLPPDYEKRLRASYPETWVRRFLDGSWDVFEGQIFTDFDDRRHVRAFDPPEPGIWWEFGCLDWGRRNPTAVELIGVDYDGVAHVWGEHYQEGWHPSQHADVLLPRLRARRISLVVSDPATLQVQATGRSVADEFAGVGMPLTAGNNNVAGGIELMQRYFREGLIVVHPMCEALCQQLPAYRWRDLAPGRESYANQPEEVLKKDDHAVDAVRYGLMYAATSPQRPALVDPRDIAKMRREQLAKMMERKEVGGRVW